MAAFYATGFDNIIVEVDGNVIPVMDGSTVPFIQAIEKIGVIEQEKDRRI